MSVDLEKVREYAALLLTPREIALLLGADPSRLTHEVGKEGSPLQQAYALGRLDTKVALRRNLMAMMQRGSPQAEQIVNELLEKNGKAV